MKEFQKKGPKFHYKCKMQNANGNGNLIVYGIFSIFNSTRDNFIAVIRLGGGSLPII